ncbi:MAG: hypothetical protein IT324_31135, partial [Anaerolineae bacterium]|nr:hypothetical protein [Anaerolineae bacterium]
MANSASKARQPSSRAGGLLISLITIFMMLGLGEIYFRYINLQSDGFYFTLMAQRWNAVCWKPTYTLKSDQYPKGEIT